MLDMAKGNIFAERFRIIRRLAVGGMGIVYEAEQLGLDRRVALKIVHQGLLNMAELNARFEREARVLSTFRHKNICLFYAYGTADSLPDDGEQTGVVPYIVMELLEGKTLAEILARGETLALKDALDVVAQMADAVAHAHEHGVIHRDIKPANIFILDQEGSSLVKVSDFGLARIVDRPGASAAQNLTGVGFAVGTPAYMSPEQTRALPASARSDIYSAGCVLYECIFGRVLFTGSSDVEVMHKHNICTLPDFFAIPGLPEGVAQVLLKSLDKDPDRRYSSMAEFAVAVRSCMEQTPESIGGRLLGELQREVPAHRPKGLWLNRCTTVLAGFVLTLVAAFLFRGPLIDMYCTKVESNNQSGQYRQMLSMSATLAKYGLAAEARRGRKSVQILLSKEAADDAEPVQMRFVLAILDPPEFGRNNHRFTVATHASVRHLLGTLRFARLQNPSKHAFLTSFADYVDSNPPQFADSQAFSSLDSCISQCIAMDEIALHIRFAQAKLALLQKKQGSEDECAMMRMMIVHLMAKSHRIADALRLLNDGSSFVPSHLRTNHAPVFVAGQLDAARIWLDNGQRVKAHQEIRSIIESSALKSTPYSLAILCCEAGAILGDREMQRLCLKYAGQPTPAASLEPSIICLQETLHVLENLNDLHADSTLVAKVQRDAKRIGMELNADDLDLPVFKQLARNVGIEPAERVARFMLVLRPSAEINTRLAYNSLYAYISASAMDNGFGVPDAGASRFVAQQLMRIRGNLEPHRLWAIDHLLCVSFEFNGLWKDLDKQSSLVSVYRSDDPIFLNTAMGRCYWWQAECEVMLHGSLTRCSDLLSKAIPLLHATASNSVDMNRLTASRCFYGRVLVEQGNLAAAEQQFRAAVESSKAESEIKDWRTLAQADLAETLLLEKRPQEARVFADLARENVSGAFRDNVFGLFLCWARLARIYEDLGCGPLALQCAESFRQTLPRGRLFAGPELARSVAEIYSKHGRNTEAIEVGSIQGPVQAIPGSFTFATIKELYRHGKGELGAH